MSKSSQRARQKMQDMTKGKPNGSWMDKMKVKMNRIVDDKEVQEEISVNKLVEIYNTQNLVFTRTTEHTQMLLGQLYIENPNNIFFQNADEKIVEYAKNKAEAIKANPEIGYVKKLPVKDEITDVESEDVTEPKHKPDIPFVGEKTKQEEETF